jgi:hypothetical protein
MHMFAVSACRPNFRPSNQRLERTGAQPARHSAATVGAGRSTVGRYMTLSVNR